MSIINCMLLWSFSHRAYLYLNRNVATKDTAKTAREVKIFILKHMQPSNLIVLLLESLKRIFLIEKILKPPTLLKSESIAITSSEFPLIIIALGASDN